MDFQNKVIIVTGASSGIGADAARHLASLGGKIAIVARNAERLNEVSDQIKISGSPTPLIIIADVTKDAERIIDETVKHFGKLDVLINNAGIGIANSILGTDMEIFDQIMATNLRSIVHLTKLAVPYLEKTNGNIVNVSSIAGLVPFNISPFYSMSKAALDQFTQCAAAEFGSRRIRINSVNPGIIETPIFENSGLSGDRKVQFIDEYSKRYPVGRIGCVQDTSTAIAFLASDNASFITGTLLKVDGGAVSAAAY